MLKFDPKWRFDSPGEIASGVVSDFFNLIGKIANQGDRKAILEHFKAYFAGAAGITAYSSSSVSWAESDLESYMRQAAENAPLFIEAFYDACEGLAKNHPDFGTPDVARINRVLFEHQAGYEIKLPDLISQELRVTIAVTERVTSLDAQAQEIIQKSLSDSEQLLSEGRDRQAVQEILWLLETISTAFQGLDTGGGTVQGKYFNKIADDLRKHHRGKTLDQVLQWVTTLHGYLSSPTGGGIRHGADLRAGIATQPNEARLFCNLIRSYISYLMAEHERLSRSGMSVSSNQKKCSNGGENAATRSSSDLRTRGNRSRIIDRLSHGSETFLRVGFGI